MLLNIWFYHYKAVSNTDFNVMILNKYYSCPATIELSTIIVEAQVWHIFPGYAVKLAFLAPKYPHNYLCAVLTTFRSSRNYFFPPKTPCSHHRRHSRFRSPNAELNFPTDHPATVFSRVFLERYNGDGPCEHIALPPYAVILLYEPRLWWCPALHHLSSQPLLFLNW